MSQHMSESFLHQLDHYLVRTMNDHMLVGLAAGIVQPHTSHIRMLGLASVEYQDPITMNTTFRLGHLSTLYTAMGLMRLWEEGAFQLDDEVNTFLRSYQLLPPRRSAPAVTFRHLLTHTAGIGEIGSFADITRPYYGIAVPLGTPPTKPPYHGILPLAIAPQMKCVFSHHTFATVEHLIEDMRAMPFADYMQSFLRQSGIHAIYYPHYNQLPPDMAQGYSVHRGIYKPVPYHWLHTVGSAGAVASIRDVVNSVQVLLNGGSNEHGTLLATDTLAQMFQPHYQLDERLPAMGLAFMVHTLQGKRIVWQTGSIPGFSALLMLVPDDDIGIVLLTNQEGVALETIAKDMVCHLFDMPPRGSDIPRNDVCETPYLWHELCGFYSPSSGFTTNVSFWHMLGGEVEVYIDNSNNQQRHLAMRSLKGPLRHGVRLYPVDATNPLAFHTAPTTPIHWPPEFVAPPLDIVFKRTIHGNMNRLTVGFDALYKRPFTRSVRFGAMLGTALAAGAATALAAARTTNRAE